MTDKARKLGEQPAFPCSPYSTEHAGLSKREQFAMAAMQAIIQVGTAGGSTVKEAAQALNIKAEDYSAEKHYPMLVARDAVIQADAMLEALAARDL